MPKKHSSETCYQCNESVEGKAHVVDEHGVCCCLPCHDFLAGHLPQPNCSANGGSAVVSTERCQWERPVLHHRAQASQIAWLLALMCFAAAVLIPVGMAVGLALIGMEPDVPLLFVAGALYGGMGIVYRLLAFGLRGERKAPVVVGFVLGMIATGANGLVTLVAVVGAFVGGNFIAAVAAAIVSGILVYLFVVMTYHCGCVLWNADAEL